MNLLPRLGVAVGWGRHGNCLLRSIQVWRGTVPTKGLAESATRVRAVIRRNGQVPQKAARNCSRCARRWANWITL